MYKWLFLRTFVRFCFVYILQKLKDFSLGAARAIMAMSLHICAGRGADDENVIRFTKLTMTFLLFYIERKQLWHIDEATEIVSTRSFAISATNIGTGDSRSSATRCPAKGTETTKFNV